MTETQALLSKIAGLRQRLQQAQGLVQDADVVAAALVKQGDFTSAVRAKVEAGSRQQTALVNSALAAPARSGKGFERRSGDAAQLTSRASRVLRRAHDLLSQLRAIADNSRPQERRSAGPDLSRERQHHRHGGASGADLAADADAQVRSCEGLEAVLNIVSDRLATISMTLKLQRERRSCADRWRKC